MKILVVDDSSINLEAAKVFFSKVDGHEFIYAKNRQEAQTLVNDCDGLITDRSMPFKEDGKTCPDDKEGRYGQNSTMNGEILAVYAEGIGKVVVMVTEHGRLGIGLIEKNHPHFQSFFEKSKKYLDKDLFDLTNPGKDASEEELWEYKILSNPLAHFDFIIKHSRQDNFPELIPIEWVGRMNEISKKSEKAWELAWTALLKQL